MLTSGSLRSLLRKTLSTKSRLWVSDYRSAYTSSRRVSGRSFTPLCKPHCIIIDQSRFGSLGRLPILINLPHTSVHCLAVVIAEDQLLFAVVSLNVTHNERNMPEIGLGEIGWIDSERLGISANNGFELSLHQLERLHKFAWQVIGLRAVISKG